MSCQQCGSVFHKTENLEACEKELKCLLCGMCLGWHLRSERRHTFVSGEVVKEATYKIPWEKGYSLVGGNK